MPETLLLKEQLLQMTRFIDNEFAYVNQIQNNSQYYLIEDENREKSILKN
jgi:hypothetical protein